MLHYFQRGRRYLRVIVLAVLLPGALVSCHQGPGSRTEDDSVRVMDSGKNGHSVALKPSMASGQPKAELATGVPGKAASGKKAPDTIDISRYRKDKSGIPPFKIRLVDGKGYTYKDLKKDLPTLLIYFQPDCLHCQQFAAALEKRLPLLSDRQIVLISFAHIKEVSFFDRQYHLSSHPDVKIGSEGYTFLVQKYYQIEHFPFVACFDKQGKLVRVLNPELEPAAMAALL